MKNKKVNAKNVSKFERGTNSESGEVLKIIKILVGVLIFFFLAYLLMGIITGEIKFGKDKKTSTDIQYEEILAGTSLEQNSDDYYVVYYDFNDKYSLVSTFVSTLSSNNKVYKVDLSKKFNEEYIGEVNINAKNINELKVSNPTLIRVKNKQIVKVVSGESSIKKYVASVN